MLPWRLSLSISSTRKQKKRGEKLTIYAALSAKSMEVILPAFMKRFPGVTIDHIDATADQLIARIVAEMRGGRVLSDVFGGALPYIAQISDKNSLPLWQCPRRRLTQAT